MSPLSKYGAVSIAEGSVYLSSMYNFFRSLFLIICLHESWITLEVSQADMICVAQFYLQRRILKKPSKVIRNVLFPGTYL